MELPNLNKDRQRKRKSAVELGNMVYGKVPPQAKDLEEAVLGAMMLERGAFDIVGNILKPECFYVEAHQHVFRAVVRLNLESKPIDLLTVVEELKSMEMLDVVGVSCGLLGALVFYNTLGAQFAYDDA